MMTDQNRFSAKISRGLPIGLLALSMAFGASAVRAQSDTNAPSWREIAVDPIISAMRAVEKRLATVEATVALFAGSFSTQQLNTRQLCVSDDTGAETCISKAQLDALLAKMAQAAAVEVPAAAESRKAALEAPAVVTEAFVSPVTEPSTLDSDWIYGSAWVRDSNIPAAVDPAADQNAATTAPAIQGQRLGSKQEYSAEFVPALGETTAVIAPEPAAMPAEGVRDDATAHDPEPATTGSVTAEPLRDALVWYPAVEISTPSVTSSDE
jgi:hypothetical protein